MSQFSSNQTSLTSFDIVILSRLEFDLLHPILGCISCSLAPRKYGSVHECYAWRAQDLQPITDPKGFCGKRWGCKLPDYLPLLAETRPYPLADFLVDQYRWEQTLWLHQSVL